MVPSSVVGTSSELFLEFETARDGPLLGTGFDLRDEGPTINEIVSVLFDQVSYTVSCKKIPACLNYSALFLPTDLGSQCIAHQP